MQRRFYSRTAVDFEVTVTNRTAGGQSAVGRIADMSTAGLGLLLPVQFAKADVVQLDIGDSRLIGRVIRSTADGAQFRHGIHIQKVFVGGSDLSKLLERTLLEAIPDLAEVEHSEPGAS